MPPASRPSIALNGRDAPTLSDALLDLTIVDDGVTPAVCTARFVDLRQFEFGAALKVTLGDDTLFTGRVDAIEADFPTGAAPTSVVRGHDRLADLQRSPRARTFEHVADADLVRRIAAEHGLLADVALTGPVHRTVAQLNQTSLEFLRERLQRIDAVLWIEDDVLHSRHTVDRSHGTVALAWGGNLRAFAASADLSGQRTRVEVSGWDVTTKSPVDSAAGDSVLAAEIGTGRSGASVLSSTLGAQSECIVDSGPTTGEIAQVHAAALFKSAARQFVVGRGESTGSPVMRVGSRVAISGVGKLFSGSYDVTQVQHRFDPEAGFHTAFIATSARLPTTR